MARARLSYLVDTQLLLYAHNEGARQHARARAWIEKLLSGTAPVGLPWAVLLGFVRLMSTPALNDRPLNPREAWTLVEALFMYEPVFIPAPGTQHATLIGSMLGKLQGGPKIVTDAHLAAIALEHGLILCTNDGGFTQYKQFGLKVRFPVRGRRPRTR